MRLMRTERVAEIFDVIVVGGGLAGGMAALAVAQAGHSVGIIECGALQPEAVSRALPKIKKIKARLAGRTLPQPQPGYWPVPLLRATRRGRLAPVPAGLGIGPGGSSAIYFAALSRYRRSDFQPLSVAGALPREWPFEYDELRPFYARAERLLRVAGTRDPLDPEDDALLRLPPPLGPRDAALMQTMQEAGLHPYRLHVGIDYRPGCSECAGQVCSRGCKADGNNSGLREAMSCGARLFCEETVVRLEPETDGLRVISREGGPGASAGAERSRVTRAIILAAGAMNTPLILARSSALWRDGTAPPLLGRGLMFHISDIFGLRPPRNALNYGPQKTLAVRDLYDLGEIQSMGIPVGTALIASHLAARLGFARFGPGLELLRAPAGVAARFLGNAAVFNTVQEDHAYPGNRVWEDPRHPGRICFSYEVPRELRERFVRSRRRLKERLRDLRPLFLNQPATPNLTHPMGTCRMGSDPIVSVSDAQGRVWGLSNVVVADASALPSSGATNPSLTIAANALRVAEALAGRLSAGAADPRHQHAE
jgi:choline dehydrogenase-like flavoprotein